jgi:hypothetical protein
MSSRKRFWIGSAGLIVLLFLLFFRIPVLEIAGETGSYYLKENEFTLRWIHSIEKEEWLEHYVRNGDALVLTETYFKTFGAGTPYESKATVTKDGFITMQMDMELDMLDLTISERVETTVLSGSQEIPLYEYFGQYEHVTVIPRELPIWEYIRGDFL